MGAEREERVQTILALLEEGPRSATELAQLLGIRGGLPQFLSGMAHDGLIVRVRNESNRWMLRGHALDPAPRRSAVQPPPEPVRLQADPTDDELTPDAIEEGDTLDVDDSLEDLEATPSRRHANQKALRNLTQDSPMSERAGQVNVYRCDVCGKGTVTKNRDDGTTPFMISCRATPGCKGSMQSSMYRVDQTLTPDLIWINPTPQELSNFLKKQSPRFHRAIREHVAMGGLLEVPAKELVH